MEIGLEDRMGEITAIKQNIEKKWKIKNEDSLRDLWDNSKLAKIHIIWLTERERTWENVWRDNSWKLP